MITTYYGPTKYEDACECEDCNAVRMGGIPETSNGIKLDQFNTHRKRKNIT